MLKKFFMLTALCCILLAGCGKGEEIGGVSGTPDSRGAAAEQDGTAQQGSGSADQQNNPAQQGSSAEQGSQSTAQQPAARPQDTGTEKPEIVATRDPFFEIRQEDGIFDCNAIPLHMQFFHGEPVVLWLKQYLHFGNDNLSECGIFICKADGSKDVMIPWEPFSKILEMDELSNAFITGYSHDVWHLDEDGCLYCAPKNFAAETDQPPFFLKIDASGELVFMHTLDPESEVVDFLCPEGGKTYVALENRQDKNKEDAGRVVEFDPDTGEFAEKDALVLPYSRLPETTAYGEGEDGALYLYGVHGIQRLDMEDGSLSDVMAFAGSTYSMERSHGMRMHDFRVLWDGSAELLYFTGSSSTPVSSASGLMEKICIMDSAKTPVTLRASQASNWLKAQAAAFNSSSPSWRVVLEEPGSSGAPDADEYARQTSIEIAAGKGPDILCGDLMGEYFESLAGKGALVDLSPYFENSGIHKGDLLPSAFGSWQDGKTYGVSPVIYPYGYKIRAEAPGASGITDIRTLLDALGAWEEDAAYYAFCDAGDVLELLLRGSDSLWGMVDWEAGKCDFGGELFGQMLEASKRLGYDPRHRRPNLVQYRRYDTLLHFDSLSDLAAEGMAPAGILFDDGCRGATDPRRMLAVNAASSQKEGAWEFILFLLGEDAQMAAELSVPVNRAVLEAWAGAQLEEAQGQLEAVKAQPATAVKAITSGDTYVDGGEMVHVEKAFSDSELTQARVEEYLQALAEVQPLPMRTIPLLDIILEEAGSYFSGDKDVSAVSAVIENRVQLYLDERR